MRFSYTLAIGFIALQTLSQNASAAWPNWTYSEQGTWGALEDTDPVLPIPLKYPFATCGVGRQQSPIDLETQAVTNQLNRPVFNRWEVLQADFYNSGYGVQVQPLDPKTYRGTLSIGRDVYPLVQFHFHSPSEHVIGTKLFAAELHYVHIRSDGRMAVIGVLIEEGTKPNPYLQTILDQTPHEAGGHNTTSGLWIDPMRLLPSAQRGVFYTYAGSLTTPPCSEGVAWYVLNKPITATAEQIKQLQQFVPELNNREPQLLWNREVLRTLP